MIKCPNCSANLEYKAEDEKVYCEYCGSKFDPKELKTKIDVSEEHNDDNSFSGKSYRCRDCGATLLAFDETAITFCSYCGSQAMIESKMIKINNPDFIIPFKKTKEECIKNYKKKLRRSFFAPSYMKSDIIVSKFRGIYIPYGVYRLKYHGKFSNTGSKRSHRSGDYVYYNDYAIVADTDTEYDGISFDLLSKFYDKYSLSLPFDYKECEPFNANYLAGFYADTKDVPEEKYDELAEEFARDDANIRLKRERFFKKYGCSDPKLPISVSKRKTGMFPVYFLAIRDKQQKHVNYAVINGQTGKVAVSLPLAFRKFALIAILLSILLYLLLDYSNILLLPTSIVKLSIVASIVSMIVSKRQLKKIEINRKHLDDLGFTSTHKEKYIESKFYTKGIRESTIEKALMWTFATIIMVLLLLLIISKVRSDIQIMLLAFSSFTAISLIFMLFVKALSKAAEKINSKETKNVKVKFFRYLYKQLLAITIALGVLVVRPVKDIYYYGSAFVAFIFIIIAFYDLVKEHNELVSNILPQLEKRGGDEREK